MFQFTCVVLVGLAVACNLHCCLGHPPASTSAPDSRVTCQEFEGLQLCGSKRYADPDLNKETGKERYCMCKNGQDDCPLDQDGAPNVVTVVYNTNNSDLGNQTAQVYVFCKPLSQRTCQKKKRLAPAAILDRKNNPPRMGVICQCKKSYKKGHLVMMPNMVDPHKENSPLFFSCQVKTKKKKTNKKQHKKGPRWKLCRKAKGVQYCGARTLHPITGNETSRDTACTCQRRKKYCPFDQGINNTVTLQSTISDYGPRDNVAVHAFCETLNRKECKPGEISAQLRIRNFTIRAFHVHCLCTNNGPMELRKKTAKPKKLFAKMEYICHNTMTECKRNKNCFRYQNLKNKKVLAVKCLCPPNNVCSEAERRGKIHLGRCQPNSSQHA